MKNKTLFIFLIICFLPFKSYSAPCYGTETPDRGEFIVGAQTYVILRRYLEKDYGKVRSTQHFFQISYGVFDWLSIDLKGGAGNIKQHPIVRDEIDYSSSFAGGYGFRARILERDKLKMVFGFQHISVHPKRSNIGIQKNKSVLDDWQVSLLGSYDFTFFRPYLGAKWDRVDYIHWVGENRKRKMSNLSKLIGMVAGFDIPINDKVFLNLEGQAFDGEAFSFALNYKF